MKWSTMAAVLAAPLALAGSIERDLGFVERRNSMEMEKGNSDSSSKGSYGKGSQVFEVSGGSTTVVIQEIIVIWVNNGGGATTSQVNSASTAAGAAAAVTHTVIVGGAGGLVYTPNSLSAAVGDMVIFQFESQNHTATQSAFTTPCEKLEGGMDTGFMPNPNNTVSPAPQMAMQVKVSTPIWFYCRQKGHCGKGMTFSINPTANKTQAMFEQMAIAQNGTGAAAPIVGGSSVAPPAATVTTAVAAPPASAPPAAVATMASGSGSGSGSVCECSCLCGVSSFASSAQGVGAFGGLPGSMPMAAMMKI